MEGAISSLSETRNAGLTPRADHTLDQPLERYTQVDHDTWQRLYARQTELLRGRVSNAFYRGLDALDLPSDRVPVFAELNRRIGPLTGWTIVAVPGLLPDEVFFEHLAHRRFPASWWMRRPEEMDYVEAPDVFHSIFGHAPHLVNPMFADYLQAFGEGGVKARRLGALPYLARLYWHTVKFGLINSVNGLRIYGAGIISSKSELLYALESHSPNRIGFDLTRVLRTRYRVDTFQRSYFVISSFRQLYLATRHDFTPLYELLKPLPDIAAGALLPDDVVLSQGDRSGWGDSEDV